MLRRSVRDAKYILLSYYRQTGKSGHPLVSCRYYRPNEAGATVTSKPKLRASNILAMKHTGVFAMPQTITVAEAVSNMAVHSITSALVVNDHNEVEGIFTSRDLLRYLHFGTGRGRGLTQFVQEKNNLDSVSKLKRMQDILQQPIATLVTRREKIVSNFISKCIVSTYIDFSGVIKGLLFSQ